MTTPLSRLGQDLGKTWALPESDTPRHTRPPFIGGACVCVSRETRTQARLGRACKAPPAGEDFEAQGPTRGRPAHAHAIESPVASMGRRSSGRD